MFAGVKVYKKHRFSNKMEFYFEEDHEHVVEFQGAEKGCKKISKVSLK